MVLRLERRIAFYIAASFVYAALVTCLALWSTGNLADFYNARPARGEMGLGRFLIRGSRIVNGRHTPFAYAWRLVEPTKWTWLSTWIGYAVHQLGQWYILAKVQRTMIGKSTWSNEYRWWNWQMVYLNTFMMAYKLLQGHLFYDGLAIDVSEGTAQGSVIAVLIVALLLAVPRRGIAFNYGKFRSSDLFNEFMDFVKKYHGYVMSFGTIYNFHYHPAEGTVGHFGGFLYQSLLLWQSASFLHTSHCNKSWNLLLETWVFVHGTLTAICQPGTAWQIFSYGFVIIFLTNQIYDTPIPKQYPCLMAAAYAAFAVAAAIGFQYDRAYYRMTFVPVAEYMCLLLCIAVGIVTAAIVRRLHSRIAGQAIIVTAYIATTAALTIGLAVILAGNLKVYNDY